MSERNEALFEVHGVSPEHTPEQGVALGKAMLIALGSAGPLSAKEMEAFLAIATEYGATPEAIEGWKRFDYANGKVDDHLKLDARLARHMMYDAIRICAADAPPGPIAKVAQVGRALGIDRGALASLEAVTTAEDALRRARSALSAAGKGMAKGMPPAALAGLGGLAAQESKLRTMRLSIMDSGKP
jgi:hypothetical protein